MTPATSKVEQLDLLSILSAQPKRRSIVIRWAQETDLPDIQQFIGKPLETSSYVIMVDSFFAITLAVHTSVSALVV